MRNNKRFVSKLVGLLFVLVVLVSLSSCMTARPVANNAAFPGDGSKYTILGRVTVKLDLAKSGGGYAELLEAAKKQYPNADDVVNVITDAQYKKGLFSGPSMKYVTLSGIAIDYKEVK